ncbi:putative germin-like protein 2-2 isoform X2 [Panicum virgatum]|uniref:putative germin-like protein 2-2 isoform X2 n=1 Tax=Panicum virgatum TaxID=38727 RepID=UPI0019D52DBB|nr:putative germin-like protein 2-2 isoform X2 [Panicum virgatum]
MASRLLFLLALLAMTCCCAVASDPSLLQDFCVADKMSQVNVNGFTCKDAKDVVAEDFFFSGLHVAANTNNKQGSVVTAANVAQIPGLNTMGISMVRIDYAPKGQNPPHTHPRATEILAGLVHFQFNYGTENAVALAALSSQNPGVITIANTVFGSEPSITDGILAKAFQVDKKTVNCIQSQF